MKTKLSVLLVTCLFLAMLVTQVSGENVDLKKVAERVTKAFNAHDAVAVASFYTEDATMIGSGEPEPIKGRKAIEENQVAWYRAFPDVKIDTSKTLISENYIVIEFTFTGTLEVGTTDVTEKATHKIIGQTGEIVAFVYSDNVDLRAYEERIVTIEGMKYTSAKNMSGKIIPVLKIMKISLD